MICNPVVVQSGGESRVYSITDVMGTVTTAEAGEYVETGVPISMSTYTVKASNGVTVPFVQRTSGINIYVCYIMPSADVTIIAESDDPGIIV